MIFKYLLVIAVVLLLYLHWKKQRQPLQPPSSQPPPLQPPQQMVACAQCGLHLPARDALRDPQQRPYCCEAHRRQGPHD